MESKYVSSQLTALICLNHSSSEATLVLMPLNFLYTKTRKLWRKIWAWFSKWRSFTSDLNNSNYSLVVFRMFSIFFFTISWMNASSFFRSASIWARSNLFQDTAIGVCDLILAFAIVFSVDLSSNSLLFLWRSSLISKESSSWRLGGVILMGDSTRLLDHMTRDLQLTEDTHTGWLSELSKSLH